MSELEFDPRSIDPWDWKLSKAGVYRQSFLDEGGYYQLIAVGSDHRALERVRVFERCEERRLAQYLRHEYGLHDGDRRCRDCREWFVPRSSRHVRCGACRTARRDRRLEGGL